MPFELAAKVAMYFVTFDHCGSRSVESTPGEHHGEVKVALKQANEGKEPEQPTVVASRKVARQLVFP